MNLHAITSGVIAAVNPPVSATWRKSNGYTKTADYKQVPGYVDTTNVQVQMQGLSAKEVAHMDYLNITGIMRALHVPGNVHSVSRTRQEGGDLFIINGETWLVVQVLETWADWSRVAVCLQ